MTETPLQVSEGQKQKFQYNIFFSTASSFSFDYL